MTEFKDSKKKYKILLIDDNAGEVIILKSALEAISMSGIEYEAFQAPKEAIHHIESLLKSENEKKNLPHIILLDLNMPEMNGTEVLTAMKKHKALKTIPIIIMTTSCIESELKKCYELGANSVMQKPMDFDDYIDMLDITTKYWLSKSTIIR